MKETKKKFLDSQPKPDFTPEQITFLIAGNPHLAEAISNITLAQLKTVLKTVGYILNHPTKKGDHITENPDSGESTLKIDKRNIVINIPTDPEAQVTCLRQLKSDMEAVIAPTMPKENQKVGIDPEVQYGILSEKITKLFQNLKMGDFSFELTKEQVSVCEAIETKNLQDLENLIHCKLKYLSDDQWGAILSIMNKSITKKRNAKLRECSEVLRKQGLFTSETADWFMKEVYSNFGSILFGSELNKSWECGMPLFTLEQQAIIDKLNTNQKVKEILQMFVFQNSPAVLQINIRKLSDKLQFLYKKLQIKHQEFQLLSLDKSYLIFPVIDILPNLSTNIENLDTYSLDKNKLLKDYSDWLLEYFSIFSSVYMLDFVTQLEALGTPVNITSLKDSDRWKLKKLDSESFVIIIKICSVLREFFIFQKSSAVIVDLVKNNN